MSRFCKHSITSNRLQWMYRRVLNAATLTSSLDFWIIRGRRSDASPPNLSTGFIDECYQLALKHGATAGKITGAGGGGFMLIYCHRHAQEAVTNALEERGLKRMNFHFDHQGATVVLNVANFNLDWIAPYSNSSLSQ